MASRHDVAAPGLIEVRTVVPRADLAYRQFLVASLLLAVLVGFVLGIHVTVSRLLDIGRPERTADLIQAHGQVQLLGFAGLYVMGMSLRLLPRFAGAPLQLAGLLPVVLWSMVASLVLRAAVLPWTVWRYASRAALDARRSVCWSPAAPTCCWSAARWRLARGTEDASSAAFLLGAVMLVRGQRHRDAGGDQGGRGRRTDRAVPGRQRRDAARVARLPRLSSSSAWPCARCRCWSAASGRSAVRACCRSSWPRASRCTLARCFTSSTARTPTHSPC